MVESRPRAPQQALHGAVPMGRAVGQRSPADSPRNGGPAGLA